MHAAEAIESVPMPAHKDDLKRFCEVLKSKPADAWGMIPKQYLRYSRGEMPAEFAWLLDRPELIVALLEDSVVYRERKRLERDAPEK